MVRIIDISIGISPELPVWPGDTAIELVEVESMEAGANANVSRLSCGVHIGTHVDAPSHFVQGAPAVESLPLEVLTGRAYLAHLPEEKVLSASVLEQAGIPQGVERLLCKTGNSSLWAQGERQFREDFVAVDPGGAEWIVQRGIRLIGVDYLSVAPFKQGRPTHTILLKAGIVVVEGLDLSQADPGWYTFTCLPLKLLGSDGAPARAILIEE